MTSRLGARIRRFYLAGVLVLAPTAVTLWVVWGLFRFFDSILGNELRARGITVFGLGFVLLNVLLLLLGWLATNFLGKRLFAAWDALMHRAPLINKIYATLRQIAELLLAPSAEGSFGRVAAVEFPSAGTWGIGFVTAASGGETAARTGRELRSVFIPSAVNPTTGFLLLVPEQKIVYLEMTPEQAMKMIVSAGALVPADSGRRNVEAPENVERRT